MAKQTDEQQAPAVMMAKGCDMTEYGMTVDQIVDGAKKDYDALSETIKKQEQTIEALNGTIDQKNREISEIQQAKNTADATVDKLKEELALTKVAAQEVSKMPANGMQRLPSGGLRIVVTLDQDAAVPLLSQAEQAGEDPGKYIANALGEALLAYTSS